MLTGYLTTLPTDTLLSAGVLYYPKGGGYVPIGVTDGAPDFDNGTELGEIMFDNRAPSRLKGLTRTVGFNPVVKGTLKEFGSLATGNQIAVIEPGETEATASGTTTVTPKAAGAFFQAGDYVPEFRWVFERAAGGYACIYAPLAICRKWSKKGTDKKEALISFEFEFVGDPVNDLSTAPYAIELRTSLPSVAGSLLDLVTTLGDSNIKHLGVPVLSVNLSGSNVTSVPDVRGGANPILSVVGVPTYSGGVVTLNGTSSRLESSLIATFAHDTTKDYALAIMGSVPTATFPTAGMATDDFTADLFVDSSGTTIQASGSISAIESNVPLSSTLRLAIIQKLKALNTPVNEDSHTTAGIITFEVWGTPRQVSWSVDPSSVSGRLTFGGWRGFSPFFASMAYAGDIKVDKALKLTDVQAIQRFASTQIGIGAYTGYRPYMLMGIGDSIQAGNYITGSTPTSYIDLVAADAALANYAYTKRALTGVKGYEQAALFDTLHGPDFRPAQWAKTVVVICLGTNDRFHGSSPGNASGSAQSATDWINALDGMCAKVRAAHPTAVIVVGTTPDTGFWQQASDTWQQTVNTHVRGMPGAGKCDLVLDFQTVTGWDPVGTPANFVDSPGVHPVQTLQNTVKTKLLTLLSGHL